MLSLRMDKTSSNAQVEPGNSPAMNDAGDLFDQHAAAYEEELAEALSASGEGRGYFVNGRVGWLRRCLRELGRAPQAILDFGCGDGSTTPVLLATLEAASAIGTDVSEKSLAVARRQHATSQIAFEPLRGFAAQEKFDLAYCNGVFHHIEPHQRASALAIVRRALCAGGLFALWENNPWNPATRYVMSRCAFDHDAQTLTPPETRALLQANGFEVLRTDFRFIFPRALRALRRVEDYVCRWPLGTQYQVLSRKVR